MKKNYALIKKLLFMLLLLPFLLALVSCISDDVDGYSYDDDALRNDSPIAVAIILGNHANAMAVPDDAYLYIKDALEYAVYGGYVCAIVADATPTQAKILEEDFFEENARNSDKLNTSIRERKDRLIDELKTLRTSADSAEVDLLAAIREAKNALTSIQANHISQKHIIIIDTGISTTGDLNFTEFDFQTVKPDVMNIVNQLKDYEGTGVLPDLTGITVTFVGTSDGLAEVAAPQSASVTDKKYIKELWTAIIEACGADDIQFVSAAGWYTPNNYTEDAISEFPYVSVVHFHHESIISFPEQTIFAPNNPDTQPDLPNPPFISQKLESQDIGFIKNSSDLYNEADTEKKLKPYATDLLGYFEAYPDKKIWLVGTSATTSKNGDGSIDLSLQRAEKVKEKLISFGVPEDKLLTIGLGAKFPWHIDEFPNGDFDTNIAQNNRAVWILSPHPENEKFHLLELAYENDELLPEVIEQFTLLISSSHDD